MIIWQYEDENGRSVKLERQGANYELTVDGGDTFEYAHSIVLKPINLADLLYQVAGEGTFRA